jgi:hypothetical protein
VPADVEALRIGDLALGDEPKLGVGEGVEGHPADLQQPGAELALDLEPERAFGARDPAASLDPQLPIDPAQVPGAMLDPRRSAHALKVQAGVRVGRSWGDQKHWSSIVTNAVEVICSHDEIGRTIMRFLRRPERQR